MTVLWLWLLLHCQKSDCNSHLLHFLPFFSHIWWSQKTYNQIEPFFQYCQECIEVVTMLNTTQKSNPRCSQCIMKWVMFLLCARGWNHNNLCVCLCVFSHSRTTRVCMLSTSRTSCIRTTPTLWCQVESLWPSPTSPGSNSDNSTPHTTTPATPGRETLLPLLLISE